MFNAEEYTCKALDFEQKCNAGIYGPKDIHLKPREEVEAFLLPHCGLSSAFRWRYIKSHGFTIYTQELYRFFRDFRPNVPFFDVMCGSGYLSRPLKKAGRTVYAVDHGGNEFPIGIYHSHVWKSSWESFFKKHRLILRYKDPVVLVSWPPMTEDMAEICDELRKIRFKGTLFYIGEGQGGCNASDRFFSENYLTEENDFGLPKYKWGERPTGFDCPRNLTARFFGLHDTLCEVDIWNRREKKDETRD